MNLLQALAKTPFRWSLEQSENETRPGSVNRVKTMLLTSLAEPGAQPVAHHYRLDVDMTLEHMVAVQLKKHFKDNAVLHEWLDSKGNVPVELEAHALESIGECMHTALRKLADSKQSVITWNALHHLHSADRIAFWTEAQRVVSVAFEAKKPPTRRDLAKALQEALVKMANERRYAPIKDDDGDDVKRKALQEFSLLMLGTGCEMTELDEWMYGWLGYVVKDVEVDDVAVSK